MNAHEFVRNYIKLAPAYNDLKKINVNDEFINEELNRFHVSLLKNYNFSDDLWNLVNSYEVGKIIIADIQLGHFIEETETIYYVGVFESVDRIVIEKVSKYVKILNAESEIELFLCGINSDSFLRALLVMAEYFITCMIHVEQYNNAEYSSYSLNCTAYLDHADHFQQNL